MDVNVLLQFIVDDGLNMNILQNIANNIEILPENNLHARQRRAKTRNTHYFELTIPIYTDNQFKEHFRMTRRTFDVILPS